MSDIAAALIPVFLVIAVGWGMRRMDFPGDAFWPMAERVTYFVIFPCFIVSTLTSADLSGFNAGPMTLGLLTGVAAMTALVAATRHLFGFSGPQYTSVFQGAIRWNGFVALATIATLYGKPGLALAAVSFGVLVPIANLLCVYTLKRHASHEPLTFRELTLSLAGNPLLIACAIGIAINALGVPVPGPIGETIHTIGVAAVPLGLLAVGASLDLGAARQTSVALAYTSVLRLAVMPLLMFAACTFWGVTGMPRAVAVICGATPTATSAYILARQLGGDATLMANLITATTLAAIVTMPVVLSFLI